MEHPMEGNDTVIEEDGWITAYATKATERPLFADYEKMNRLPGESFSKWLRRVHPDRLFKAMGLMSHLEPTD